MSYLAKKLWKKPIFGFLFFLTNFPVCIQTYGREWEYKNIEEYFYYISLFLKEINIKKFILQ